MSTGGSALAHDLDLEPMTAIPPELEGYSREAPTRDDLRAAMTALAAARDWRELSWAELMEALLRIGRTDIPLARLTEGHVDAVRICAQAGYAPRSGARYGVWASRSQATGVRATVGEDAVRLDGTIRFASGAGIIDRALVPAWFADGTHTLIDLDVASLPVDRDAWQAAGMRDSHSHTVTVDDLAVDPGSVVGPLDFYLSRPGFLAGGIGVAAVWAGCAGRLIALVTDRLRNSRADDAKTIRLGRLQTDLVASVCVVRQAGELLDRIFATEPPDQPSIARASVQARSAVAAAVERIVAGSRLLAGAAGVAHDAELTRALDDLGLYVLQHHGDADALALGSTVLGR